MQMEDAYQSRKTNNNIDIDKMNMNSEKSIIGAIQKITIGEPAIIKSDSIDNLHGVVFEDDGETGYFYALDYSVADNYILESTEFSFIIN